MPRLGIDQLARPEPEFDPVSLPLRADGAMRFESARDARREDRQRLKLLRRQLGKDDPMIDQRHVRRLYCKLAKRRVTQSLASARRLHRQRRRIIGALWKLVRDED